MKNAWALPRRYSGLFTGIPDRREHASVVVRNVGHWTGDPLHYHDIVSALSNRNLRAIGDAARIGYALTPFGVVAQSWTESKDTGRGEIQDTYIFFFYAYESFLQECLAFDARQSRARPNEIIDAYEHVYSNVTPLPDAIPRDPRTLKLARFANAAVEWDEIVITAERLADDKGVPRHPTAATRSRRETLFFCRLQTHLMVALATAVHGVAPFLNGAVSSPLIRPMASTPNVDELAAPWLGHVLGLYDHAAECATLLQSLARHYGRELTDRLHGLPIPPLLPLTSPAEQEIVYSVPPMLGGRDEPGAADMFRWRLFDTSLDDESVRRWSQAARRWAYEAEGINVE